MTAKPQKITAVPRPSRKGKKGRLAIARREEVVRLALALVPITTIATRIGVARETVHRMLAEPETADRLAGARVSAFSDSQAELRGLTRRAVGVLSEELEGDDPAVRVRAAVEVLKLAGAAAPKRIDFTAHVGDMTDEQLDAELWRLQKRKIEEGGEAPTGLLEVLALVANQPPALASEEGSR